MSDGMWFERFKQGPIVAITRLNTLILGKYGLFGKKIKILLWSSTGFTKQVSVSLSLCSPLPYLLHPWLRLAHSLVIGQSITASAS